MGAATAFWNDAEMGYKLDPIRDALYYYDKDTQKTIHNEKPWNRDVNYFKSVRISALALIKMTMHARSGGSLEVMGLMQGYVDRTTLVVSDAFRLPVEGTETRVNAQEEANEYLVEYLKLCREQGRVENVIGWYHSHPGYGCWLSGIDVSTQSMQQAFNDPFVAVVIDPDKTMSANKVEIGAFRTYPDTYTAAETHTSTIFNSFQAVPLSKAGDFGAHSSRYYSLEVEHFKSSLDTRLLNLLWNKYWVQTLSQSPLITNRDYESKLILDLGHKIKDSASSLQRLSRGGGQSGVAGIAGIYNSGPPGKALYQAVEKAEHSSKTFAAVQRSAMKTEDIKTEVFGAY